MQLLALMNNAAKNVHAQVLCGTCFISRVIFYGVFLLALNNKIHSLYLHALFLAIEKAWILLWVCDHLLNFRAWKSFRETESSFIL